MTTTEFNNTNQIKSHVDKELVFKTCETLMANGIKVTVGSVSTRTGGNRNSVTTWISEWKSEYNARQLQLAEELGSSEVGKMLSSAIQQMVNLKTERFEEVHTRQKEEIADINEQIEGIRLDAQRDIDASQTQLNNTLVQIDNQQAKHKLELEQKQAKIDELNVEIKLLTDEGEKQSGIHSGIVENLQRQIDKLNDDLKQAREENGTLKLEEAKWALASEEVTRTKEKMIDLQNDLAGEKVQTATTQAQLSAKESIMSERDIEINRLREDLKTQQKRITDLERTQTKYTEQVKEVEELKGELRIANKERELLTQQIAIAIKEDKR